MLTYIGAVLLLTFWVLPALVGLAGWNLGRSRITFAALILGFVGWGLGQPELVDPRDAGDAGARLLGLVAKRDTRLPVVIDNGSAAPVIAELDQRPAQVTIIEQPHPTAAGGLSEAEEDSGYGLWIGVGGGIAAMAVVAVVVAVAGAGGGAWYAFDSREVIVTKDPDTVRTSVELAP